MIRNASLIQIDTQMPSTTGGAANFAIGVPIDPPLRCAATAPTWSLKQMLDEEELLSAITVFLAQRDLAKPNPPLTVKAGDRITIQLDAPAVGIYPPQPYASKVYRIVSAEPLSSAVGVFLQLLAKKE